MSGTVTALVTGYQGDPVPDGYVTSMQLIDAADITYRQLDFWTRRGHLTPATVRRPGSGYSRLYTRDQIARAATLRLLTVAGLSLEQAVTVVDDVIATGTARLPGDVLIAVPTDL